MKTRKMKRVLSIVVLLVMGLSIIGCSKSNEEVEKGATTQEATQAEEKAKEVKEQEKDEFVIGASIFTREHVFWNMVEESLVETAEGLGVEIIVTDGKGDSDAQYAQIQDFVTQNVDAIILAPVSTSASAAATKLANDAGIPVFTLVIDTKGERLSFIGVDNIKGGELAGEYAAEALNEKATAAIISFDELEICIDRATGFKNALEKYPDMNIVAESTYSGDMNKAASVTQDFITQYPDLDLIYAVGDPAAVGAVQTIKAANKEIKVIGFDGNPEFYAGTKNDPDIWIADVQQDPKACAALALATAVEYLNTDEDPDKVILLPPTMIDTEEVIEKGL